MANTPQPATNLVGLTHLRAVAIVLVFVYHYGLFERPAWIDRVGAFGWTGVDLFFVLSGFLISKQLFRSIGKSGTFSLREFYFKRALRILPAYLVVLACYFWLPYIHEREALPPLWKFLTFTQNLGLDLRTSGTFSHAWSLCIEEQFYLVLPLVLLVVVHARRGVWWLLPGLFTLGFVARAVIYAVRLTALRSSPLFVIDWYKWIYYPTWSRLDGLLVGIALAAIYERVPTLRQRLLARGNRTLALGVASWAMTWWLFVEPYSLPASVLAFPAIALVYGVLLIAALSPSSVLARYSSRVTHWLATLSYTLYLTHKACIHVVQQNLVGVGIAANGNSMFVCCIIASLLIAALLHFAVERQFMRWRDRALKMHQSWRGIVSVDEDSLVREIDELRS